MNDRLWRIEDVMQYAGIRSRNTVYKAIRRGLPVIKLEGIIRFNPETVKSFFNGLEA